MSEQKAPLESILDAVAFKYVIIEIMKTRAVSPQDEVTYQPIEKKYKDVTYIIKAEHVPIEYLIKYSSSNCKKCNSKGYSIIYVSKSKIANPQDFVVLADRSVEKMSDEEKKLWLEVEKKKPTWRVMLPCKCTIKNISKKEHTIVANDMGNIVARLSYEIKQEQL